MNRAVIFDVNETMLDLGSLDSLFVRWFGDPVVRKEWFARTLHLAFTLAATRAFQSFSEVGAAALVDVARHRVVALPQDASIQLREAVLHAPAHADVAPALHVLRDAKLAIGALSNNPLPVVKEQLRNAGLSSHFTEIMSVDEAGALKPAPAVYQFAAGRFGLPTRSIWMVAAHGWDIAGATRAGMRGAFVARPDQLPDPFVPPEITSGDLVSLAYAIVEAEHSRN